MYLEIGHDQSHTGLMLERGGRLGGEAGHDSNPKPACVRRILPPLAVIRAARAGGAVLAALKLTMYRAAAGSGPAAAMAVGATGMRSLQPMAAKSNAARAASLRARSARIEATPAVNGMVAMRAKVPTDAQVVKLDMMMRREPRAYPGAIAPAPRLAKRVYPAHTLPEGFILVLC